MSNLKVRCRGGVIIKPFLHYVNNIKSETATGYFCLLLLMGLIYPLFLFVALALYIHVNQKIEVGLGGLLFPSRMWFFAIPFLLALMVYFLLFPFPGGDMLRDIIIHRLDYDYSRLYPDAPLLPSHNLWLGFDIVVGHIDHKFGAEMAARVVSASVYILVLTVTLTAIYIPLKGHRDKWFLLSVISFTVLLSIFSNRAISGRPELIAMIWLISATFLKPWIWVSIGVLCSPVYWLWPMYSLGGLLLKTEWKCRLISCFIVGVLSISVWMVQSESEWVNSLLLLKEWSAIGISRCFELKPILAQLLTPSITLLILASIYLLKRSDILAKKEWFPYGLVAGIALLPNYERYAPIFTVILAIGVAVLASRIDFSKVLGSVRLFLLIWLPLFYTTQASSQWEGVGLPEFNLPEDAYVLTQNDNAQFHLILQNPYIKTAPALEPSASEIDIQLLMANLLRKGVIDCKVVKRFKFTHVLESSLVEIPECLKLMDVERGHRLWRVNS